MSFERVSGVVVPFPQGGRARAPVPVSAPVSVSSVDVHRLAQRRHLAVVVRAALLGAGEVVIFGLMLAGAAVFAALWLFVFGLA